MPVLIALALVLVVLQPRLARALAARRERDARRTAARCCGSASSLTGIYGGYFGAAQGVILLALEGIASPRTCSASTRSRTCSPALVNGVAALIFIFVADVAWLPALLLAVGSTAGGQLGAKVGRRLSPTVLRGVIVVVGLAAIVKLVGWRHAAAPRPPRAGRRRRLIRRAWRAR